MTENQLSTLEERVNRLEMAFRLLPFMLLAAIGVAIVVLIVFL